MVINRSWASIFVSLFILLIGGSVSYAWTANAQIAVLRSDVDDLKKAELSIRLARMEGKIDWIVDKVGKK